MKQTIKTENENMQQTEQEMNNTAIIGTLKEKSLHNALKNHFCSNEKCHEIKIGRFVADIFENNEITEIQTKNFKAIVRKLEHFLPKYKVTVVYPLVQTKWIYWVNPQTKLVSQPRKSTKKGKLCHALSELYHIRQFLNDSNLTVKILIIDAEEYRIQDGFGKNNKNRATKQDIFLGCIYNTIQINNTQDLIQMMPQMNLDEFTAANLQKAGGYSPRNAFYAKKILLETQLIQSCGKQGRSEYFKFNTK